MHSPYQAPLSAFPVEIPLSEWRWRAAAIFSALPALVWVVCQAAMFYFRRLEVGLAMFEPTIYITPVVIVTGLSGFLLARRCVEGSGRAALMLGAAVGVAWTALSIIAGNVFFQILRGLRLLSPYDQLTTFLQFGAIIIPIATANSGLLWHFGAKAKKRAATTA